jgi:hypothetical protein
MNNYQDNQEVRQFIQGMSVSIKETIEEINDSSKIPSTILYLLKRVKEGEVCYGLGGGAIPDDEIGLKMARMVVPKVIEMEGNEILCTCEAIKVNGEMKIKFINHITKDETFEIVNLTKPSQVSDLIGNICLN